MSYTYGLTSMRNSFEWPPHWRKVIAKMSVEFKGDGSSHYIVHVLNPEYLELLVSEQLGNSSRLLPERSVARVEFDSLQAVDDWARVAARIS